jgi:succinate dehydrogenase / fumarate reductase flavoprotein subunit/fumarate reductase flavoprotein subunit
MQASEAELREMCERWSAPIRLTGGEHPNSLRREIEDLMWEKVGLVRNGVDLKSAFEELAAIGERAERQSANPQTVFNLEWNEALDVMNICTNAQLVTRGALLRKESRGSHFRSDFPKRNPEWLKRIRLVKKGDGIAVSYLPVKFTRMTPPELESAQPVAASRT